MRRTLVVIALAGVLAAAAAAAVLPVFEDPAGVKATQAQLATVCGQERARVIGEMSWALEIHRSLIPVVTSSPVKAKVDGDAAWQRYWVDVYTRTVALLEEDCPGG